MCACARKKQVLYCTHFKSYRKQNTANKDINPPKMSNKLSRTGSGRHSLSVSTGLAVR